jgi:hypothetical protein
MCTQRAAVFVFFAVTAFSAQGCSAARQVANPKPAELLNPRDSLGNMIYRMGDKCAVGVQIPPYKPCEAAFAFVSCPKALDDPAWYACAAGAIEWADGACVCRRSNGTVGNVDCPARSAPEPHAAIEALDEGCEGRPPVRWRPRHDLRGVAVVAKGPASVFDGTQRGVP